MGQSDGISKHYKSPIFFNAHSSEMITEQGKILTLRFMPLD